MTDYSSQGKSRPDNPVELSNCRDHRAYYVSLSRGFTANGTIIVQKFDTSKITSGMSGYLRQELRELEILDEVTRLRSEGRLPFSVNGLYRRRLIRSFYAWKTSHRDPPHFHSAMRWKPEMGPRIPESIQYDEWKPSLALTKKRKNAAVDDLSNMPNKSMPGPVAKKPKLQGMAVATAPHVAEPERDIRSICNNSSTVRRQPVGLIWDSVNHSCAYDATLTILANIWLENPDAWTLLFSDISVLMKVFARNLTASRAGYMSLE
ncbi:hypothetical protein B0H13DRAFT_2245507 [Mycena leptocephala]|nr:hypothetical protein B0H13DRAFT_2245507 [Mycena leptocephala]